MGRLLRAAAASASLMALALTGCGQAAPQPAPSPAAARPAQSHCSPAAHLAGFCLASLPDLYCCSAAYTGWSHIYVGQAVDVRGSVPLFKSGKPEAKDVFIVEPDDRRILLPVDAKGGYNRRIRFATQGKYLIGLVASGPGTIWSAPGLKGIPFYVAYRTVPAAADTLAHVFPASRVTYGGITVLAAPIATTTAFRVRFLNASGRPAAHVALTIAGEAVTTDAQGYARFTFRSGTGYALDEVYTGLFVQTYSRVAVENGALVGLPVYAKGLGPARVRVLTAGGQPLVDVQDFLLSGVADIFQSSPPPVTFDAQRGVLTLARVGGATLDTKSGEFMLHQAHFKLHPVVRDGQVYLSLPEFSRMLNIFAWARPQADGSLLFSTYEVP